MAHFVQKRGAGFLDWAAKCGAADVDFVSPFVPGLPDLAAGEMSISSNGLFQADNDFRQLTVKKSCVQQAVHLFELPATQACLYGLFHFENLSFKVHFKSPLAGGGNYWPQPATKREANRGCGKGNVEYRS